MVEIDTRSFTTPEQVMPLPRGKDGKAIRIGDVVYGEDGRKWLVRGIHYGEIKHNDPVHQVHAIDEQRHWRGLKPEWLSHERPDSWERIADEIEDAEGWCDQNGGYGTGISSVGESTLREWADRIRKLAKEEARDGD